MGLATIGVGLSMGVAAIGAGIGTGIAGAASTAGVAEDPKQFGMSLVMCAIPQTQGVYGFLGGMMILIGTGILGGPAGFAAAATKMAPILGTTPEQAAVVMGLACVGAGLGNGLGGITAIGQGITCAANIGSVMKNPAIFGKAVVLAAMSETFAVFSLVTALLILIGMKIMGG
ncbi:MAG: hypothetical protein NTV25_04365 [Methanothrix sp.]|nr:hypothetical protein [Methanothrix sp.]